MRQKTTWATLAIISMTMAARAAITGHWDFRSGDLKASVGSPLTYLDGPEGQTARETQFDTTSGFALPALDGDPGVKVMSFPQMNPDMGYVVTHGAKPNGDGEHVNQYTVLMDILFPASSAGSFRAILQTDNEGEADIYLGPGNEIGTVGDYAGTLTPNAWHRLVLAFDLSGRVPTVTKYVDGERAGRQVLPQGRDGRWSVGSVFSLFNDPGNESRPGFLHCVQFRDRALSDAEVRLLGGPTARGLPTNDVPEHPFVDATTPAANSYGIPVETALQVNIVDGRLPLARSSVQLTFNGARVVPDISRSGGLTRVRYQPNLPLTQITNTVVLTYGDGTTNFTERWTFVTSRLVQPRAVTGHWDFKDGTLRAKVGANLEYLDGGDGASRRAVRFATAQELGVADLPGRSDPILDFRGASSRKIGLVLRPGAIPNGPPASTRVNQWTLILDLLVPNARKEPWLALLQTDSDNSSNADAFVRFMQSRGVVGSLGDYQGIGGLEAGHWHRLVLAVDNADHILSKYIDGKLFATQALRPVELDGRYSLGPSLILFGDDDGESQRVCLGCVQLRNYTMEESEIVELGGAQPAGIPLLPAP